MGSFFRSIRRSWTKHFVAQVSAFFILTMTYTTALFTVVSSVSLKDAFHKWGKIGQATIYLQQNLPEARVQAIKNRIVSRDFIASATYISPKASADRFGEKYKKLLPNESTGEELTSFFPSSIELQLTKPIRTQGEADQMKRFSFAVKEQFKEIEEVSYGQSWLYKYTKIIDLFENVSIWVGFTLFLASLFVTSNVLKSVLYSRKPEIEVMEMVGATPFWIFGPQVLNCCMLSLFSLGIGVLLNIYTFTFLSQKFRTVFENIVIQKNFMIREPVLLTLLIASVLVSVFLTSVLAVKNIKKSDPQKAFRIMKWRKA